MSQDQGRSTKPTARYESDEVPLLPAAGQVDDDNDDFVVEAGAFGSGQVIDARPLTADDSAILAETGGSSEDLLSVDRDAMTITDHKALVPPPGDPNNRTRAAGEGGTRQLGSFDLERKVGQGGMGEVWLARQRSLDRLVAVKVLPRSLASQESFLERFQREARAAASLKHPHVIQVYEFGIEDGTPYFAMEYVEGEDLQQVMRRERYVNLREAVEVVRDVASALEAAHAKGIIHRDIKPSNVMIDRDGIVKVMDFGLAKATASDDANLTNAGLIMGTPNYLSPEQGRGDPLDSRSDLYSLGVVFYELLAGKLPFRADTPAGLIFKHVYEPPPDLLEARPDLPPFLVDVCNRLLQKDREERYPSAAEVLADLDEFLDNAPHYMDGGERRPNAGSHNPMRVASGRAQAIRRAARRRTDSDRSSKAESGINESVTEEIEASSVEEMIEASGSDVALTDSASGSDVTRLDQSSGTYPTPQDLPKPLHDGETLRERVRTKDQETRREERPTPPEPKRPHYLRWAALAALVLVVLSLRFGAPDATASFFHRQTPGLAAPLSSFGVLAEDPRPRPLAPTQLVFETPALTTLPGNVEASLVSGEAEEAQAYRLTPGERNAFPPGSYVLRYSRKGYVMDQPVELVAIAGAIPNSGKLNGADGADPWAQVLDWTPTSALLTGYREGRTHLEGGRSGDAIAPLEAAVALDPEFSEDGPTAAELLAQARGGVSDPQADPLANPQTDPLAFDPSDSESVRRWVSELRTSLQIKNWRKVLADLKGLDGLESADSSAYFELSNTATEALKEADQKAADFAIKLEDGTLDKAGEAHGELKLLDPYRPDLEELRATLARARERRALAFGADLAPEERKKLLEAYLELAKHDEGAANKLREVKERLQWLAELAALEAGLRELAAAGSWAEAKAKSEELLVRDAGNAVAAEVGGLARLELDRDAILEAVVNLDATLVDDPTAFEAFLPNATERRTWKDFLAFSGRFTASSHAIERESISVTGDTAVLEGLWSFELALLDQPAQPLDQPQRIALKRTNQGWIFQSFEVLE